MSYHIIVARAPRPRGPKDGMRDSGRRFTSKDFSVFCENMSEQLGNEAADIISQVLKSSEDPHLRVIALKRRARVENRKSTRLLSQFAEMQTPVSVWEHDEVIDASIGLVARRGQHLAEVQAAAIHPGRSRENGASRYAFSNGLSPAAVFVTGGSLARGVEGSGGVSGNVSGGLGNVFLRRLRWEALFGSNPVAVAVQAVSYLNNMNAGLCPCGQHVLEAGLCLPWWRRRLGRVAANLVEWYQTDLGRDLPYLRSLILADASFLLSLVNKTSYLLTKAALTSLWPVFKVLGVFRSFVNMMSRLAGFGIGSAFPDFIGSMISIRETDLGLRGCVTVLFESIRLVGAEEHLSGVTLAQVLNRVESIYFTQSEFTQLLRARQLRAEWSSVPRVQYQVHRLVSSRFNPWRPQGMSSADYMEDLDTEMDSIRFEERANVDLGDDRFFSHNGEAFPE